MKKKIKKLFKNLISYPWRKYSRDFQYCRSTSSSISIFASILTSFSPFHITCITPSFDELIGLLIRSGFHMPICLFIHLSIYRSIAHSASLCVYVLASLSLCFCLCVCFSVSLSLSLSLPPSLPFMSFCMYDDLFNIVLLFQLAVWNIDSAM